MCKSARPQKSKEWGVLPVAMHNTKVARF
ncbi:hypothetical protein MESS4_290024 [Mesorhizobium sp. STM 4661]|nr:hypothetical protein MESS4_290024 [Mesorhizobium sp. STM 4661]